MRRTVIYGCFTGHGFLLLLLLFFGIAAVPTPSPTPTTTLPDITSRTSSIATAEETATLSTSTTTLPQNVSLVQTTSSQDKDPPAIVNDRNVTETEIVITEARHGKSLHHPHNELDTIKKNDSGSYISTTEQSVPSSSEFTAKLATDGDHEVQQLGKGDAPAKVITEESPKGKPQEWGEPRLVFVPSTTAAPTDRDKMIQKIFGGECNFSHWNRCSRIEFWGGDYLVPDKNNPGKFIVRNHKIRCSERPKSTICLRNGWTVARCHMLCMSQCNVEYRMEYEKLVLHEGDCKLPILFK